MRTYFVCVLATVLGSSAVGAADTDTKAQISKAIDYARSGLTDDAKKLLIPLLHDEKDREFDPQVRFVLGATCLYQEQDETCGTYHWIKVLRESPYSEAAGAIRDIFATYGFVNFLRTEAAYEDWAFQSRLITSRQLWSYIQPDWKMKRDVELAVKYLDGLLASYTHDKDKTAVLLYDKFLIIAGYNGDEDGLVHATDGTRKHKRLLAQCQEISDTLGKLGARHYYIRSQFLLGVEMSRSKLIGDDVKVVSASAPFFENVVRETQGDITSPYGIFASTWLQEYYERKNRQPPRDLRGN